MTTHASDHRVTAGAVALLLVTSLLAAAPTAAESYAPVIWTTPLLAGQDIHVGNVTITDDGDFLNVTYETDLGWLLAETHVDVQDDADDVPGKRNPRIGHFAYATEHDPAVDRFTYVIDFGDLPANDGTIVVAAHAVVLAFDIAGNGSAMPMWADNVVDSGLGTQGDGDPHTDPARTDPNATLGVPDAWFYSPGFDLDGGDDAFVTVNFSAPVFNGPDDQDILVSEITFGRDSYPREEADIFVRQTGGAWMFAGHVTSKNIVSGPGTDAVAIPDGMLWVDDAMIVDRTNASYFDGTADDPDGNGVDVTNADGYDLDSVGASYLLISSDPLMEETAWADGERFTQRGSWATYMEVTLGG